jgi:hypothetical protein
MATSTYPTMTGAIGLTEADKFIPELWSDEIIAAYKKNLVLANLVNKMSMVGKKGDTLHIPKPTRGLANVKAENTAVTIQNAVESEVIVTINKHYEYSRMDDEDTPMDGRLFVIPPSARQTIMGIDRYVSSDFVNGRTVNTGLIGNLYGVDVYVSSNCPVVETASDNSNAAFDVKAAILAHRDTMVLAEQMSVRSQTQYKQEFLANLYTADTLYGVAVLRPETGFVLALPA